MASSLKRREGEEERCAHGYLTPGSKWFNKQDVPLNDGNTDRDDLDENVRSALAVEHAG